MPLEKIQQARVLEGATINDVFLSCTAGALRRLLREMHYDPDQGGPLVAGVPVAGERPPGMETHGNFATADSCWLHTNIEDPLQRLQASHDSAAEMKEHIVASKGADINALVSLLPQWATKIVAWVIRRQEGRIGIFGNVLVSNVPGPREPLYLGPIEVDNWFSTGQVFDGTSLNMTMWSYCGKANLCILADKQVLPDGWKLYGYFCEEIDRLIELGKSQDNKQVANSPGA
jgi:WS/DGAT/MGAT family acyltransferase